jgi:hypothetical protein
MLAPHAHSPKVPDQNPTQRARVKLCCWPREASATVDDNNKAPGLNPASRERPPRSPQELVPLTHTHHDSFFGLKPIRLKILLRVDALTDTPLTHFGQYGISVQALWQASSVGSLQQTPGFLVGLQTMDCLRGCSVLPERRCGCWWSCRRSQT